MGATAKSKSPEATDRNKSIRIRPDLHLRLKRRAVDEQRELYDLAEELLEWAISKYETGRTKRG